MPASDPAGRDPALLQRLEALYPAVVSDELDRMGFRDQVMRPDIRPLFPEARLAGYAFTVHAVPVFSLPEEPYKLEMESVDRLQPGDVMCVSPVEGSFWGELLSTAAGYRGCRGVVVDGYTRDTQAIIRMGFPTFVRGIHMADSLGRLDVAAYNVPIQCGGVAVRPGDLLLGDYDGIVVIPQEVAPEAISRAEEKVRGENLVRKHLQEGMPVSEAFRRFGVI
ncbi:MAG TPA: RraA family protein [Armatimonadota bacterium]|nr:RraA family protein [Armatimonadota bacterium]